MMLCPHTATSLREFSDGKNKGGIIPNLMKVWLNLLLANSQPRQGSKREDLARAGACKLSGKYIVNKDTKGL